MHVLKRTTDNVALYFRSRITKGYFHYVIDLKEATKITKSDAVKLLKEVKYPEKFEIMEVK